MTRSIRPAAHSFDISATGNHALYMQTSEEVDLNDVLRNLMTKMEAGWGQLSVIQKFDKLPVVTGRRDDLTLVFEALLSMVFSLPPDNTKILLYIQCIEEKMDEEIMDLGNGNETPFSICFHTNIQTCDSWLGLNKIKLDEAYKNASKISASLFHYNITKTGCLFSLKISGKIL